MSIRKNFFYNSILTVSNYLFPLITYPYISRVLGVTNVGVCNFVDSIVNYFILFSMMGMSSIGIREIACVGSNQENRNKVFSSLFTFNALTTIFSVIVYVLCIFLIPELYVYRKLLYIGLLKLIANFFLINWLFAGLEDFKYITIRSIIVQLFYVVAVFTFIRDKDDYPIYYLLLSLSIVINATINCIYSRKFVKYKWQFLGFKSIFKSSLILGFRNILTSMYTTFNVLFLGLVSSSTEVGYYTTATKLYSIIIAFFTAFTSVMLPRMSSLISDGKMEQFKSLVNKSIELLCLISLPMIIYTVVYASDIIHLLSGEGYEGAIIPMQIVMPLILIIGLEQILITQTLVPLKKDKAVLINTIFGAIVGILLNLLLVSKYEAIGSSMVWLFSEIAVLISAMYFVKKNIDFTIPIKYILKQVINYLPCCILLLTTKHLISSNFIGIVLAGFITFVYMILINITICKNELISSYVDSVLNRIKK